MISVLTQFDPKTSMTTKLFVPHVLKNIFFSLDYDSSMECRKVCKEWSELLSFDRYEMEAKKILENSGGALAHLLMAC